jgi:hypothetical protein
MNDLNNVMTVICIWIAMSVAKFLELIQKQKKQDVSRQKE